MTISSLRSIALVHIGVHLYAQLDGPDCVDRFDLETFGKILLRSDRLPSLNVLHVLLHCDPRDSVRASAEVVHSRLSQLTQRHILVRVGALHGRKYIYYH